MIKRVLRTFVTEGTALYLATQIADGLHFAKGPQSLVITALALTAGAFFVKPVISILILPINLMTFNFFKWVSHAVMLFLVDLALVEFSILSFTFKGFSSDWLSIPQIFFEQGVVAYIAFSFIISIIAGVIHWVFAHD